ncbi:MAG: ATP-binding protein [Acidobacteriota bacterium]
MKAYEKLGLFYLGKVGADPDSADPPEYFLYDSRDLLTHAVCVGMTGSGKTGLCITLLEEAAIDGIPVIAVDPKGDLGNLFLAFPDLAPGDFRPWIQDREAQRLGHSPEDYARREAERWRQGLADWDQDGERIRLLQSAAEPALYTPGSTAGMPVSIVDSFAAPGRLTPSDLEPLRERASTLTAGLLGLLGLPADPLRSREHILIASILEQDWMAGRSPTLASLIQSIQAPPLQRVGVFDLEAFYPSAERLQLAMMLNNLLASPGFASWIEGEALDLGRILHDRGGKPRLCIFSIAHLSDQERMFFVTLLLNQVLAWVRTQPGTTSLRTILYMDEIFGFLPPVGEPPSKRPFLTLLKQARAYGLGVVLATQNPVDLDYKALSNAGTWFIGRLQTERDRDRLLDGLAGLAGGSAQVGRGGLHETISSLKNRAFLMQNVHEDQPVVFTTRWALSYLAGPLSRDQIRQLTEARRGAPPAPAPAALPAAGPGTAGEPEGLSGKPPLPSGLQELFLPPAGEGRPGEGALFHPFLYASARMHILNNRYGIASSRTVRHKLALEPNMTRAVWAESTPMEHEPAAAPPPQPGAARFVPPPTGLLQTKSLERAAKAYIDFLHRQTQIRIWKSETFKVNSQPGEPERDFRIRLQQMAREKRDFEVEKLRRRYASRLKPLERQLLRAREKVEREREQFSEQKTGTAIAVGSTLLAALIGRKAVSYGTLGRAATAARRASRMTRERQDIERAEDQVELLQRQISEIEEQLRSESDRIAADYDPQNEILREVVIRPSKSDLLLENLAILWEPRSD